jgi:hypothetical protein
MDYPVTRGELTMVCGIGRTTSYDLQDEGKLTPPCNWCGKVMFCLKFAMFEISHSYGVSPPTDEALLAHWALIVQSRAKKDS